MARNTLAGKGYSRKLSPAARKRKLEYDKQYQKKPSQVKKRVEANKANRRAGTYGNKDGKDASHKANGRIVMESRSANRARNGMKKGSSPQAKRSGTRK